MDNLARMLNVRLRGNLILPCLKILRGIDIAARDQGARFEIATQYVYTVGRQRVTSPTFFTPLSTMTLHAVLAPMWVDVDGPALQLPSTPDAGTTITCTAWITIRDAAGNVVDTSLHDVQTLMPTAG